MGALQITISPAIPFMPGTWYLSYTLCWIDKEPTIHTDISQAIAFSASPVLIQSEGGQLTIQGADDGTPISIYTTAGMQAGYQSGSENRPLTHWLVQL